MKTNTFTATNEEQVVKIVPVNFAPEVAVRIAVRHQVPAFPWSPRGHRRAFGDIPKPGLAAHKSSRFGLCVKRPDGGT